MLIVPDFVIYTLKQRYVNDTPPFRKASIRLPGIRYINLNTSISPPSPSKRETPVKTRLIRTLTLALAAGLSFASHAADVTVSAAASLTNAFKDIAPLFEAANPGTKVQFNFAASGVLLQKTARGAPADVFASADQETMDQAQAQNLVKPSQRRDFVSNALVVIVPSTAANTPKALADLNQ